MKLKFLGSCDSSGIPVHNCKCCVCADYRKRGKVNLSTCAYIEDGNSVVLLDCGIDSISQTFDGKKIEAIFLTHFHADHCMGLLRLRHSNDKITCYHPQDLNGFDDLFKHPHNIIYTELEPFVKIEQKGFSITPIPLAHSRNTLGYLLQTKELNILYLTDCCAVPKKSFDFMRKFHIDLAFIDACYDERRVEGNHLNYLQASSILDSLEVGAGYLLHSSHTTLSYIMENKKELKYPYLRGDDEFILE